MDLCVYSSLPIGEMETLVRTCFSLVVNKNVVVPAYDEPKFFNESNLGFLYKIEPVMNNNRI
jgi:secreted Zn-dependent insulinase-like peptidase